MDIVKIIPKGNIIDVFTERAERDENKSLVKIIFLTDESIIKNDAKPYSGNTSSILSNATAVTSSSLFTPKNIFIGVVGVAAGYGILKWLKVI